MSREIKFRAWSELDYKMYVCDMEEDIQSYFKYNDGITLEQYTGFKDNSGLDIYEGDIIVSIDTGSTYLIVWKEDRLIARKGYDGLLCRSVFTNNIDVSLSSIFSFNINIIGNIHENKILL